MGRAYQFSVVPAEAARMPERAKVKSFFPVKASEQTRASPGGLSLVTTSRGTRRWSRPQDCRKARIWCCANALHCFFPSAHLRA